MLFALLSICIVWLPSYKLVYGLLWHGNRNDYVYGQSLYAFWHLKRYMAFALLFLCEMMKTLSVFFVISLWFKDDIFALHISSLVAFLQIFQINLKGHNKIKLSKSLAPVVSIYILMAPLSALLLTLFYMGNVLFSKRSSFSAVNTLFLAPVILLMTVHFDLPYYWGLLLPLVLIFAYQDDLARKYPFKESSDI